MSNIKTVSILVFGVILFQETLTLRKVLGMVIAVTGVFYYSYVKMDESGQLKKNSQASLSH